MAERSLAHEFPATADELQGSRDCLREHLRRWGEDDRVVQDVVLAVDEACQNVIRHAYCGDPDGRIELRVSRRPGEIEILVRDYAEKSDPGCLERGRDLDELRPGGLGTHFIRELMDVAEFVEPPDGRGNLLRMVKRI
jgi:sigma-B regulation protein RsbU (phosphoserine phosphatase)